MKAVAPKPVNVLVSSPSPDLTVARLTDLGVRRISVGSALARVAWGAFIRAARSIATTGTFDSLAEATPFAELNELDVRASSMSAGIVAVLLHSGKALWPDKTAVSAATH